VTVEQGGGTADRPKHRFSCLRLHSASFQRHQECGRTTLSLEPTPSSQEPTPPHAWGRRALHVEALTALRFTPTRVGTTSLHSPPGTSTPVHPHTRGDDRWEPSRARSSTGSPPHAWGRHVTAELALLAHRFTPTRVGTTAHTVPYHTGSAVHPHTRGDDAFDGNALHLVEGSPPHAWGRPPRALMARHDRRFTPTRVGTTPNARLQAGNTAVHPHTRGDDAARLVRSLFAAGSPPHAWGRPAGPGCRASSSRFTPTRVGTTIVQRWPDAPIPVHPHTRGDDEALC